LKPPTVVAGTDKPVSKTARKTAKVAVAWRTQTPPQAPADARPPPPPPVQASSAEAFGTRKVHDEIPDR
jgi:hypothetical protein